MTSVETGGRVHTFGDWHIAELTGELDCSTIPDAEAVLLGLPRYAGAAIVVDLNRVTFFDCSALDMLVRARKRSLATGGTFHLVCAGTWPRRILRVVGLLDVFRPVDSAAELVITPGGPDFTLS